MTVNGVAHSAAGDGRNAYVASDASNGDELWRAHFNQDHQRPAISPSARRA